MILRKVRTLTTMYHNTRISYTFIWEESATEIKLALIFLKWRCNISTFVRMFVGRPLWRAKEYKSQ
jgi:hypothetical protein